MNMLNKKRISKNRLLLLGTFIFLIVLSIPTFFWIKSANHDLAERRKSQMSPVIMIPGSSATTERFNELSRRPSGLRKTSVNYNSLALRWTRVR